MASLDDAWGELSPPRRPQPPVVPHADPTDDRNRDVIVARVANEQSVDAVKPDAEMIAYLEALVTEIQQLRKEQAKRTTVYMMLVGLLFGTLILYIDRLQVQLKTLQQRRDLRQFS
jgi:hypothetical protein